MNFFQQPAHGEAFPSQPPILQQPTADPPAPRPQFYLPPGHEQALWIQQQQRQVAIAQLYYAQQGLGMDPGLRMPSMNMNMFSNPYATAFEAPATGLLPSTTNINGFHLQSMQNAPSVPLLTPEPSNRPFQFQLPQYLSQLNNMSPNLPIPNFHRFALPNVAPSQSSFSPDTERPSENPAPSSPVASATDTSQESIAASVEVAEKFTRVHDLILAKALHEHSTAAEAASSLDGVRHHSSDAWYTYYTSARSAVDKLVRNLYPAKKIKSQKRRTSAERDSTPPTRIPGIPHREPSPSSKLVPQGGGFKYTEEDEQYFVRYVLWRFSYDINATKMMVCQSLADKAAHHSLESWKTYWWLRDKDIERVRQLFKDGNPPKALTSFKAAVRPPRHRAAATEVIFPTSSTRTRPPAKKNTTAIESDADWSSTSQSSDEDEGNGGERDDNSARVSTHRNPIPYTKRDMQAVVQYLADNKGATYGEICDAFSKSHPNHTGRAWGEYYRRNQTQIDRKVRRVVRRRSIVTAPRVRLLVKDAMPMNPQSHASSSSPIPILEAVPRSMRDTAVRSRNQEPRGVRES